MSQAEEDAGLMGDALADLVEQGKITDATAFAYMAGDEEARRIVSQVLD